MQDIEPCMHSYLTFENMKGLTDLTPHDAMRRPIAYAVVIVISNNDYALYDSIIVACLDVGFVSWRLRNVNESCFFLL